MLFPFNWQNSNMKTELQFVIFQVSIGNKMKQQVLQLKKKLSITNNM